MCLIIDRTCSSFHHLTNAPKAAREWGKLLFEFGPHNLAKVVRIAGSYGSFGDGHLKFREAAHKSVLDMTETRMYNLLMRFHDAI